MKIGLIVDNPKRDLPGLVLLARELGKRGLVSYLIPMYTQGFEVPALGLSAVVVNYMRKANSTFIRSYAQAGISVCVLDTEGGVWENESQFVKSTNHEECADYIDAYCFWGERQKKAFLNATRVRSERMHVTGCPRFDFYHPSLLEALPPVGNFDFAPILVISNFALSHPKFNSPEREIQAMLDAGYERDYAILRQKDDAKNRVNLKALVAKLAKDYPERSIVIRAHPFESDVDYREEFAAQPNVVVKCEGVIGPWLKTAAVGIHFNSSVSIDAFLMRKPMLAPKWMLSALTQDMAEISFGLSLRVNSYDELRQLIDQTFKGERVFDESLFEPNALNLLNNWFVDNDGQAHKRAADVIERVARSAKIPSRTSLTRALKTGSRGPGNAVGRVDYWGRRLIGPRAYEYLRGRYLNRSRNWEARQAKVFTVSEVNDVLSRLRRALGDASGVKAVQAPRRDYEIRGMGYGAIRID